MCIAKEPAASTGRPGERRPTTPARGPLPMSKTTHAKVVIVGSGPAGYTAAIYA
ncbi:MAG: thioredoxin-disulfide reductase, partial [Pseudolabrys sp.]|nr:thioredoxin-disulfide reductase [Pseudolabrys sp.]